MSGQTHWEIPRVEDVAGRPRTLSVNVRGPRATIQTPPGAMAALNYAQLGELIKVLMDARGELGRSSD